MDDSRAAEARAELAAKRQEHLEADRVYIYAQEDVDDYKKGDRQLVFTVDAREIQMRPGSSWSRNPPPPDEAPAPEAPEAPATPAPPPTPEAAPTPAPPFSLEDVPQVTETVAKRLIDAGFGGIEALKVATLEDLTSIEGVGNVIAGAVLKAVEEAEDG